MLPLRYVRGHRIPLSMHRKFVQDVIYFGRRMPTVVTQRRMNLEKVVAARSAWEKHISWCAIFVRAYSLLAVQRPELRRSYQPFPWPQLYEHPVNIASIALEREYQGERGVFIGRLFRPDAVPLTDVDAEVRRLQTVPIESVPEFSRQIWLCRLPRPIRRLIWKAGLDIAGPSRSYFFGTFAVSVVARYGAASLNQITPNTTALNYSPFAADGTIDVRLQYDHRVFDGATTARALVGLEEVLNGPIVEELRAGPPK
ncbi:MAG: hypothetical protein K1X57_17480 [Gemmataceae bacterium]|nr:hypothetical protein [Gemmataceae bacterium]